jgi:hypothetical protein
MDTTSTFEKITAEGEFPGLPTAPIEGGKLSRVDGQQSWLVNAGYARQRY